MQIDHTGRAALYGIYKLEVEKDQFHEIVPVAAVRLTNILTAHGKCAAAYHLVMISGKIFSLRCNGTSNPDQA